MLFDTCTLLLVAKFVVTPGDANCSVQMPKGVPVATVAIGNAANAGLLAVRILAAADSQLRVSARCGSCHKPRQRSHRAHLARHSRNTVTM
jgi:phosphoribosylcarboxyaminoimidazole (NCAIR) mutase